MKRHIHNLFFLTVILCSSITAHPANGIVEDQDGNVFFADVGKNIIWKIDTAEKITPYITGVHSHDIYLDSLNQLHGEHIDYHSSEQTFYYGYWVKSPNDTLRWEKSMTKNNQRPAVYDKQGNGYMWRGNNNQRDKSELWLLTSHGDWKKLCGGKYGFADGDSAHALLDAVSDLFVDESGDLYIADLRSIRLWKDGKLITLYREANNTGLLKNRDDSSYNALFGICVTKDSTVLIANYGNQDVLVWSSDDGLVEFYQSDSGWSPTGVTVRANKDILVMENSYGANIHSPQIRIIEISEAGAKRVLGRN